MRLNLLPQFLLAIIITFLHQFSQSLFLKFLFLYLILKNIFHQYFFQILLIFSLKFRFNSCRITIIRNNFLFQAYISYLNCLNCQFILPFDQFNFLFLLSNSLFLLMFIHLLLHLFLIFQLTLEILILFKITIFQKFEKFSSF